MPTTSRHLPLHEAGSVASRYTIEASTEVLEHDTHWAEHSHATHELLWAQRGASTATVGSRVWTITPTVGLWIPAGLVHSGWTPAGMWLRAAQFSVDRAPKVAEGPVAVTITELLRLLLDRFDQDLDAGERERTAATVLDVLAPAEHEVLLQLPEAALLGPIVQAIREDPADQTSLASRAVTLNVSTRTIARAFQAETGLGFERWVATARAQKAIALLARDHSIDEIAELVGYGSASSFGTAFRRVTGMSPGRFRSR
ncbi:helix-turn-helix transcriptional regulator [Microbacteriaceae bacterium VKM Ac-2854]|nr:helix-turn-helix transcriptional regulator [Microbacteriaceae bacterium VKM Ac-2854]